MLMVLRGHMIIYIASQISGSTSSEAVLSFCRREPHMHHHKLIVIIVSLLTICAGFAFAGDNFQTTPLRLSFLEGPVSSWQPGAPDWVDARLNTPVSPGYMLYTDANANLELQLGNRAFIRAGEMTSLGILDEEPDYLQVQMKAGQASVDIRELPPAYTVEVDTPNAVFTIQHPGYYRLNIYDNKTYFIARRGGRARVDINAGGEAQEILANEEVIAPGEASAIDVYAAPSLDAWDRWNYARTDAIINSARPSYVPSGIYGAESLDRYGYWRDVPEYGYVWIPEGLSPRWAPYTEGSWVWDRCYGWTWVDNEPWGWAPFHYGRWVHINGFWGWAPGPPVAVPVYAPALVVFFSRGLSIGWTPLGWGEPVIPWWGRRGFAGVPSWAGWGGPRVVNNVVINHNTVVNVTNITVYQNTRVSNGFVTVPAAQFGRGGLHPVPAAGKMRNDHFAPVHGVLPVRPVPESLVAGASHGIKPPKEIASRPVIATRLPSLPRLPWQYQPNKTGPAQMRSPLLNVKLIRPLNERPSQGITGVMKQNRPGGPNAASVPPVPSVSAPQGKIQPPVRKPHIFQGPREGSKQELFEPPHSTERPPVPGVLPGHQETRPNAPTDFHMAPQPPVPSVPAPQGKIQPPVRLYFHGAQQPVQPRSPQNIEGPLTPKPDFLPVMPRPREGMQQPRFGHFGAPQPERTAPGAAPPAVVRETPRGLERPPEPKTIPVPVVKPNVVLPGQKINNLEELKKKKAVQDEEKKKFP